MSVHIEEVDRLLHDAEHKQSGADFARILGHPEQEKFFVQERVELVKRALEIDPEQTADSWAETWLSREQLRS